MPFFCYNKKDYCDHSENCDNCDVWVFGKGGKEVPTNADRIRAMSDEELAKFLDDINTAGCVCPTKDCRPTCNQCIVEWLEQPAEEE